MSDILAFGETWLLENEVEKLEGFQGLFASHGHGKGVGLFTRHKLAKESTKFSTEKCSLIQVFFQDINIIAIYLSKNCNQEEFCNFLLQLFSLEQPTLVLGDFNISANSDSYIKTFFEKSGFSQIIEHPTHDSGSLIDHIYVNKHLSDRKLECHQNSVYYSDHDMITLLIEK